MNAFETLNWMRAHPGRGVRQNDADRIFFFSARLETIAKGADVRNDMPVDKWTDEYQFKSFTQMDLPYALSLKDRLTRLAGENGYRVTVPWRTRNFTTMFAVGVVQPDECPPRRVEMTAYHHDEGADVWNIDVYRYERQISTTSLMEV